ncbi:MAG: IS66 family transposase, partial [Polaromonas sp.]
MLDLHAMNAQDISALNPGQWASFAEQLLAQISEQSRHIAAQAKRIDSDAQAIKWRDAKIESITFQLARLKA